MSHGLRGWTQLRRCRQINRREHPEKLQLHRSTKSSVFTHVVWVHHRVLELIVFQPERSVSLSHASAYPSLTFCQDPRRGKGRAVPDRQLIRTEPKGPSLYQRKKGIETTYSLSEEECHRGLMRRSRQQTGTGARWAWLPDWPGPGALGCCWSSVKFYQSVVLEQRSLRSTKLPSALILTREWNYFSTLPPNHLIDTWYPILWCHPMT